MTDLANLRELLEKATKGPWASGRIRIGGADPRFDGCDIGSIDGSNIAIVLHQECDRNQKETVANADLITEMMRVMPDLLDEVEKLRAAATQASFCLRELLPNDSDAQMTVRMLRQALGKRNEQ